MLNPSSLFLLTHSLSLTACFIRTLFFHKKEWTMATCDNMYESQIHFAKWKNLNPKSHMLYDYHLGDILWKSNVRNSRSMISRVWRKVEALTEKRHMKIFGMIYFSYLGFNSRSKAVYICKNSQNQVLNSVNYTVCKLWLKF